MECVLFMLDEENPIVDGGVGEEPVVDEPVTEPVTDEPINEEPVNEEPINNDTTPIITVEDLKKRLHLAGIDYSSYTDEDLQALIELAIERIEAETGLPIKQPRLITEYEDSFHNKVYETDFYPLQCCEIRLDDELIEAHRVDMDRGILYFKPVTPGDLEVKYQIQYTDTTVLTGLITNIIILNISEDTVHGTWNSIREGEVSVTYGAGSGGLQGKVDKALNELKGYYKPRLRLL